MVIDLKNYKTNKQIIKDVARIDEFFIKIFPDKTWGWVGITALLYAQISIIRYLEENKPDPLFYPAIKSILWKFQHKINEMQSKKGGEQA